MKKLEKRILILFLLIATGATAQIGVGTRTPHPDAMLEVASANKGILLPRVDLTDTAFAGPLSAHVAGMTVFNTATAGDVTPGYYYNDGSKWVKLATGQGLKGDKGDAGANGLDGAVGPQGPAGAQGLKGDTGATGPAGANGLDGAVGPQGPAGAQGLKGDTGATGPAGANGVDGAVGPQGPAGAQGLKGDTGPAGSNATVTGKAPISVASGVVSLADSGVTAAKLATDAVDTAKIKNAAVTVAKISATGTASATTFLRGDGTWATPAASVPALTVTVPATDNYTVLDTDSVLYRGISADATLTFSSALPAGKVFYIANTSGSFNWVLSPTPINTGNTYIAPGASLMVITLGGGQIMVPTGY